MSNYDYVFIVTLAVVIGLFIPLLVWTELRQKHPRMTLGQAWPGSRAWKWDSISAGHFQLYCYADVILWKDKGFRLWIGDKDQGRLYRWTLPRVLWLWWKLR